MGAYEFTQFVNKQPVADAFIAGVDRAAWEHGHGGYTGTLAEKDEYVVIEPTYRSLEEQWKRAEQLIDENDERISDKWGPAGALPVKDEEHDGWLFFGFASS